jgi:acetoin utilization protein AcuB
MKQMPQIQKFMTAMPHTIGPKIPIKTALSMMREHRIRHLPVQDGGKLVGILTDRDLKLASSFQDAISLSVEEVMSPDTFTVPPEAALDRVVFEMAEHKYGCAVVLQPNGKVVGIFTAVDALRVLGETLDVFYKPAPEASLSRSRA